jgi:hypothetical protein
MEPETLVSKLPTHITALTLEFGLGAAEGALSIDCAE